MEEKIHISESVYQKIKNLHADKIKINEEKIEHLGFLDIDDHGFVYFPDFQFEPITKDDGRVYGMELIGKNFRKFLNEIPVYINENSALACCWPGNMQKWIPFDFSPEHEPKHLYATYEKYHILQHGCGGMNHLCPDLKIGLKLGWKGLLDKVCDYSEVNNMEESEFYKGEKIFLQGVLEWINRHVVFAEKMAAKQTDQEKRKYYEELAVINKNLMNQPPQNLREACQFLAHFQSVDRMYYVGGALGQIDELLRPFYEQDVRNGVISDEQAIWYIASLLFNDTHYGQLGGLTPDGTRDITSRISFLILEASHLLKIPSNLAVRVSDKLNPELLRRSLEYHMQDGTGVCYSCNVGCEEGFSKNGYPLELARMRVKSGCNWTAIPGIEYPLQDVTRLNMPMALVKALEDMRAEKHYSLDFLWQLFVYHLKVMVDCIKEGYDWHYEYAAQDKPEIVLNLFMHGAVERGLNCSAGGADIMDLNIDGIGLATVADSFGAMEQRIEEEKRITYDDLYEALDNNYEGYEEIRLMMKNIKRLGTPGSPSLLWAKKIRDLFVSLCRNEPTPKHHLNIVPGMFSHGDIVMYGNILKATPNGRRYGEPISHSNEPDPGFANGVHTFAPTLKATVVAELQPGYGNSSPLHLDIDENLMRHEGGVEALEALIKAHNKMGGTLINLNCLTKERLLKAHADPKSDPDLVVRVTGYSAFFASLSPEYRQQIVDRFIS